MDNVEKRLQNLEYRLGTLERLLQKLFPSVIEGAVSELEAARIETLQSMRHELGELQIAYRKEDIGKLA